MRNTSIPQTDLTPSAICLGSSHFGNGIAPADAYALLDMYVTCGGNFIDTAAVYANWLPGEKNSSEKTIGRWLARTGKREKLFIGTKGAHPDLATMHISRMSPREIVDDLNSSLGNLQTDWIDLYWLHRDDPARPVAEIIDTLHAQVVAGKIRYFGCSNWRVDRIAEAQTYAGAKGITGFVANQMRWSLAAMDPKTESDPTTVAMDGESYAYHRQSGLAAIPYSSQAGGYFQKMAERREVRPAQQKSYGSPGNARRLARVQQLAQETGLSVSQIVLAYLTSQLFPTIPIVGCRTVAQVEESMQAGDVQLTNAQVVWLAGESA
ncbi:MAG: aldo/keto reductase [Caldilineaceae bacterium]|nr:aldo/keto reductase [Caldilineaceae bacterium]HRJ43637.1 aldo/keto reductase [Caldilineaceae bacterium]